MDLFEGLSNAYHDRGGPDGVQFRGNARRDAGTGRSRARSAPFGVSNETRLGRQPVLARRRALARRPRLVSIQNAYHLLNRQFELGLAEFSFREQVGLLAYSPLAQGYLTGKYLHGARPAGARSTLFNRGQRYQKPGVDEAIEDYLDLAQGIFPRIPCIWRWPSSPRGLSSPPISSARPISTS